MSGSSSLSHSTSACPCWVTKANLVTGGGIVPVCVLHHILEVAIEVLTPPVFMSYPAFHLSHASPMSMMKIEARYWWLLEQGYLQVCPLWVMQPLCVCVCVHVCVCVCVRV